MNIPRDKTVQDLFKWRVEQTPDLVAHKFLDRETSYKELDLLSNKVANGLIKEGCEPDTRVALRKKFRSFF